MCWKLWSKPCQSDLCSFQDGSVKRGGAFYVSSAEAFGCYWPPNIKRFSDQPCVSYIQLICVRSVICQWYHQHYMYPQYCTARHFLPLELSQCTGSTSHPRSRAYHLSSSRAWLIKRQKLWCRRPRLRCLITLLETLEFSLPSRTKMSSENCYRWLLSDIALKAVSFMFYWFSPPSSTPSQVSFTTSSLSSPTTSSSSSPTPAPASRESSYYSGHSLSQSAFYAPGSPASVHENEGIITSRGGMFPNARGLTFNNCVFQDITSVQPCPNHGIVWSLRADRLTNLPRSIGEPSRTDAIWVAFRYHWRRVNPMSSQHPSLHHWGRPEIP